MERSDWSDEEPFGFRPPLPPEDRVWRHPSELGATGATPGAAAFAPPPRRAPFSKAKMAVAVVVSATGALLIAGLVSAALRTGGGGSAVVESSATSFGFTATSFPAVPGLGRPSDGVVHLIATTVDGTRMANGVVLDNRGTIVTTTAAVAGATSVVAMLADGSRYAATVLGVDEDAGAAVLSVDTRPLAAASGWAVTLEPGTVIHTGGDNGVEATVAALGANTVGKDGHALSHLVRLSTDADQDAVEGTPLLDDNQLVVGLCTYDAAGHMYAVPIEISRAAARSIAVHGRVVVPWLGVSGRDEPGAAGGAVVQSVAADSPASRAGLAAGDVVVALDGEPAESMAALALGLRGYDTGASVDLTYLRDGSTHHAFAVLGERP